MKDFVSNYFRDLKTVVIRTKPLQFYFLNFPSFTHESAEIEEYFKEIHN